MKKPEWLDSGIILAWVFVILSFPIQLIQFAYHKIKGYNGDFADIGIYGWYHYKVLPMMRSIQYMYGLNKGEKNAHEN